MIGFHWQRNYYEHIIRNESSLSQIREYIVNNPMQWALDEENPDRILTGRGAGSASVAPGSQQITAPMPGKVVKVLVKPGWLAIYGKEAVDEVEGGKDGDKGQNLVPVAPGERVVVVEDLEAFASRYDASGIKVAGQYTGKLENAGELIRLEDGRGILIQEFFYLERWYPLTDGSGPSLHIVDSQLPVNKWGLASSWLPSSDIGGSPGAPEPTGTGGWQVPGDINQDAVLDVSDGVKLLLYLFSGGVRTLPCGDSIADPGNAALTDFNGSGFVDITDAIQILGYLFRDGSPPALGPGCTWMAGCPSACTP